MSRRHRHRALFSKELARRLAEQFRAVTDDELFRDCIDQATAGTLDPWQLDTLTDWTRKAINHPHTGKEA